MSFTMIQQCTDSLREVREEAIKEIARRLDTCGQVFLMGNGGSASTASHIANDLSTVGVNATSLCDNMALLTAIANDRGYDRVFMEQLCIKMRSDDVVIVFSVSGNSPNLVRAVDWLTGYVGFTIGLLGSGGGRLKDKVKLGIVLQSHDYGVVESAHLLIGHMIVSEMKRLRGAMRKG